MAGAPSAAAGAASTLAWMFVSSALIIANKRVYASGFPYPMFVTGVGQLASAAGGVVLGWLSGRRSRSLPPVGWILPTIGPLWAVTFLTMWMGNAAYLHLSVAFIQIFKAMTPAVTLVLAAVAGQERLSFALFVSVMLIALGTGGAAVLETGAPSWSVLGAALFVGSSFTEAARVVGSQRLMTKHHFTSLETLVYTSLPTAALLLAASLAFEGTGPLLLSAGTLEGAAAALAPFSRDLAYAAALSFAVNLSSFWAIASTGSLTFKVAGCLKNLAVIWYAVAVGREHVSGGQLAGYAVSVAGFLIYTAAKSRAAADEARAAAKGKGRAKAKAQ
ncbi:sugar phosphate phosphate translocator [Raphidocelis subcapitata]|uniref:Sugar phosphate phosphate translocator n=1 Tax=Raphidocelis subcapitata TaxID=307507 RepID=A0A2V0PE60_9CHLO|nr:sugar phosphate phosphate translocator [Raphidocelis subcapitata]|eukprot:GBF98138.1 sugar phosphate phosphate translocator [Raphidocelis subcapitata]